MEVRSCAVLLCVVAVLAVDEWMEVVIEQGTVRGRLNPDEDLYAFYNIPYATPPTGVHKFKAPLAPPKWSYPYHTEEKNFVCPQVLYPILNETLVIDENNCLLANVFVPRTSVENLSVLVYVHSGAFTIGYGNINKGTKLMKTKDFIMVTFNYRLGIQGFLCLGTEDIPGNAGMKDQVALLRWVQNNIASFGGNPEEVTLAGSSSGSASVDLLMLSKSAEGLFHRVIPESGGSLAAFAVQRDPLEIAKYIGRKLNFNKFNDIRALEEFYKKAPLELLSSYTFFDRTDSTFLFAPCVERDVGERPFLTESPLNIIKSGNFKKLPILYGFTSMEGLLRIDFFDKWKHRMNEKFSDFLPADLKFKTNEERKEVGEMAKLFYFGNESIGDDHVLGFVYYFSDVMITYPMLRAVQLYVRAGNKEVYLYEYSFLNNESGGTGPTIRGADHSGQSTAWLDNLDSQTESSASVSYQKMKMIVRDIWHNFIKTGKPVPFDHPSLPTWPPVGVDRSPHMNLGKRLELRGVLLRERTRFWDGIYQKFYRDAIPPPAYYQRMMAIMPRDLVRRKLPGFAKRISSTD